MHRAPRFDYLSGCTVYMVTFYQTAQIKMFRGNVLCQGSDKTRNEDKHRYKVIIVHGTDFLIDYLFHWVQHWWRVKSFFLLFFAFFPSLSVSRVLKRKTFKVVRDALEYTSGHNLCQSLFVQQPNHWSKLWIAFSHVNHHENWAQLIKLDIERKLSFLIYHLSVVPFIAKRVYSS